MNKIYTIGYTQKTAKIFFDTLVRNQISTLIDIRLSNTGQLAGFTKSQDLEYFLSLFSISYEYWKDFAPTKEIRDNFHKSDDWHEYELAYIQLMNDRRSYEKVNFTKIKNQNIVFLCSEPKADKCHRKLVAEGISNMNNAEIIHL